MTGSIADKWKRVRLGDVFVLIRNGASIKQGVTDGGYSITRIETISDGIVNRDKMGYAGIINIDKYRDYILEDGDILMSHINSEKHLGKTALYSRKDGEIIIHGMNLLLLRRNVDFLESNYTKYYFKSPIFKHQIPPITKKSVNQASFNISSLKNILISLPPLDEQKRIADVLDKASELIKKRKEQIRLMDELAKSLFIEMFGDPVENPMGWDVKTVANVCNKIVGGGTPSKSHPEYFIGDIPWISPKDMKKLIISDSIDHINQNAVENSSTTLVPPESVLMVIRSGILKHTLPVAMSSKVVALNQDMKAFTTNELATPWYLLYFFKAIEPQLLSHVRAVTADNIEYSIIKNHKIPVPPLSLQNEFADRITAIEQQKALLQNGLAKMETAYKALMQEYFG